MAQSATMHIVSSQPLTLGSFSEQGWRQHREDPQLLLMCSSVLSLSVTLYWNASSLISSLIAALRSCSRLRSFFDNSRPEAPPDISRETSFSALRFLMIAAQFAAQPLS